MSSDESFKKLAEELQQEIDKEEEATYSARVLEEYRNPVNVGRMENPDTSAIITGPCGDTMEIYLKIQGDMISEATFMTDGCGSSIACGSLTTRLATGRTIREAKEITNNDILGELGGLPDENIHCAKLAADTLHKALENRK